MNARHGMGPIAAVAACATLGLLPAATSRAQAPQVEETDGIRRGVPAATWNTILAAGGKAKVWAQADSPDDLAKARAIAQELTDKIWPKLVGRFWEPLSDVGYTVINPQRGPVVLEFPEDGGPQLDIYLVRFEDGGSGDEEGGYCMPATDAHPCGSNPRYITLESRGPLGGAHGKGVLNVLAHELTHAITHAKPWLGEKCEEYRWIDEATATWAEHFVYPDAESEHVRAVKYLMTTEQELDLLVNEHDKRKYGLYLFPFDLALRGHEAAIPEMWKSFGTKKSLAGIEAALGTVGQSYDKFFPQFMVDNWNRHSADLYHEKDGLDEHANVREDPEVVSLSSGSYEKKISLDMPYLSSTYRYFKFPNEVKSVTFDNGLRGWPHAKTWAIEKIDGVWKDPRELTDQAGETWCRPHQNLEELVLVFGNTNWPEDERKTKLSLMVKGTDKLGAYAIGCTAWEGETTAVYTFDDPTFGHLVESETATVRFELDPDMYREGRPPRYWRAVDGKIQWNARLQGQCHGAFSGELKIRFLPGEALMGQLEIWDGGDAATAAGRTLRYLATAGSWPESDEARFAWNCGDHEMPADLGAFNWLEMSPEGHLFTEGTTISGQWEMPGLPPGMRKSWTWTLRPAP